MRRFGIVVVVSGALAACGFVAAVAMGAATHRSGCHSAHTCPSDHHTYVWVDPSTGRGWDCVEPGAREYDASRDTTVIVYDGRTYYCRAAGSTGTTTTSTTTTTATTSPPGPQAVLPNPEITPGVFNRQVRQATIRRTICVHGWTKTIRPPVSYTNRLKLQQMPLYGETGSPSDYEEDHFIPLELGGAPKDPKNLWPEPHAQSRVTDPLETSLKAKVCAGTMTLAKARATIRQFKFTHG
jgi:hypothetical protein